MDEADLCLFYRLALSGHGPRNRYEFRSPAGLISTTADGAQQEQPAEHDKTRLAHFDSFYVTCQSKRAVRPHPQTHRTE